MSNDRSYKNVLIVLYAMTKSIQHRQRKTFHCASFLNTALDGEFLFSELPNHRVFRKNSHRLPYLLDKYRLPSPQALPTFRPRVK